ncbi:hypothetical protein, partial [Alistipes finegoldii]|uniref:hypothetical protein n=1 Tax=Alistipes finegoldii TaxID=214856 RepID=UPI003AB4B879
FSDFFKKFIFDACRTSARAGHSGIGFPKADFHRQKSCGAYAPQLDYRNMEEAIFWESGLCCSKPAPQ